MMKEFLPYIVTVICSVFTGFASYLASRAKSKAEIDKLSKQYELDIEKERERFAMEKEKMEIEHKYQIELKSKEMENQLGADLFATITKGFMNSPEGKAQLRNASKRSK